MILSKEQQEKLNDFNKKFQWEDVWKPFPNPLNKDYLNSPIGFGVYQLRINKTKDYIFFGRGGSISNRMASLFPELPGVQNRNNYDKIDYVHHHIDELEYRTIACTDEAETKTIEGALGRLKIHKLNT